MGILRFLFILFLHFLVVYGRNNCQTSFCRYKGVPIRFPFRLPDQPQNCGYPGFDLSCNIAGEPVLNLPYSGSFSVRDIDYINQKIKLYDPYGCIQSRLLKLNLSSSPFKAAYYRNYTFLTCPAADEPSFYIDCLSNFTHHTLAISSEYYRSFLSYRCKIINTRPIAVPWPYDSWPPISLLDDDLLLKWNVPDCTLCEAKGRMCGFKNSRSPEIQCFRDPAQVIATIRVIIIGITLPIISCLACILCYKCTRNARQHSVQVNATAQNSMTTTATARVPHMAPGLDDSTIKSYATVILGESRRIAGPNSTSCPICLADYLPKDILRCIPECEHCFHADCIMSGYG